MTAAPTPSPGPEQEQVRQVADLRQRFADLRKSQGSSSTIVVFLVVIIAIEFTAFAYFTKQRIASNFSQVAIQKAVSDRLPQILPIAGEQLQKAATDALPTYRELAAERFQKLRPELAQRARERLEKIPEETGKLMNEQLQTAFQGALQRVEPDVKATFPSLTDQQKQDLLNVYFHDAIEQRNKAIAAHIDQIYTNELTSMDAALDNFQLPPPGEGPSTDKAQRDFLHTMLMLADYELMNGDLFAGADKPARTVHSRPMPTTAPATQAAMAK